MMLGYLDRAMRQRDLVLRFYSLASDGAAAAGVLTTPQMLTPRDLDRVRKLDPGQLVDGQVVKIHRLD